MAQFEPTTGQPMSEAEYQLIRQLDNTAGQVFIHRFVTALEPVPGPLQHTHRRAQLLYTVRGSLNCLVEGALWPVPAQSAFWIPADVPHALTGAGEADCITLLITPTFRPGLPAQVGTLVISSLLRELLLRVTQLPPESEWSDPNERLVGVLLDEISGAPRQGVFLPMPTDPRLRQLADALLEQPANHDTLPQWGRRIAMSQRSLSRLLVEQTGMSFLRWKKQNHLIQAVKLLAGGESVQRVAGVLGYESASSFSAMFRKLTGYSPGRYYQFFLSPSFRLKMPTPTAAPDS